MAKITVNKTQKFEPITIELVIETKEELNGFRNLRHQIENGNQIFFDEDTRNDKSDYYADNVIIELVNKITNA